MPEPEAVACEPSAPVKVTRLAAVAVRENVPSNATVPVSPAAPPFAPVPWTAEAARPIGSFDPGVKVKDVEPCHPPGRSKNRNSDTVNDPPRLPKELPDHAAVIAGPLPVLKLRSGLSRNDNAGAQLLGGW